ncbi:MAG: hypothetical protein PHY33_06360 [Methanobacteriaceae archaeon]|nr:hypothetical protein [Methanobacteriaceae archaeon]
MSLYEGIKDVASIVQKADNIELYEKLLDLQRDALDILDENKSLKERIRELENNLNIEEKLLFKDNAYYLEQKDKEPDGPFCSVCWDRDKKLIRLHFDSGTRYDCNVCKTIIGKAYIPAPRINKGIIN